MPTLAAPAAVLAAFFLFLVPGLAIFSVLRREDREALAPDEALFLCIATSVALTAWLGLFLAELGAFSVVRSAAILAVLSVAVLVLGRSGGWPLRRPSRWRELLPAAVVLTAALALQARPSEYIVGGRDPGAYMAAAAMIGRTHGIVYTDKGLLSIPPEDRTLFYADGGGAFRGRLMGFNLESLETGRVYPEFFHLFPVFAAYLFEAAGPKGALATPPLLGVLGTLGAFFVFRRLFGPAPALLGGLLLAVNVVQVWFSSYPASEGMSQFLVFFGLLAFLHWEARAGAGMGRLAGLAFGLSLLVRIDSVLIVAPLALYAVIRLARRDLSWRQLVPMGSVLGLLAAHAVVHACVFTRKYLVDVTTRPYWHHPPAFWAAVAAAGVAAALVAPRLGPPVARWLEARDAFLRGVTTVVLAVVALYAYFVRPRLSMLAGADGYDPTRALESPGLLLTLGFQHLASHDAEALVRLGWFVTPLGLVLAFLGLFGMLRDWRKQYLLPVLALLTFSLFYLYKIRVYNDYYFALRRYVPVTIPLAMGCAAWALARLARGGRTSRAVAGAAAVALVGWLGWGTSRLYTRDGWRVTRHVDWKNAVRFVADVARRFGPDDVVIFEPPRSIHLLSLPLWADYGVNVMELARANPQPERLSHLIEAWRKRYRNIYFVHTYRTNLCGVFLQRVEDYAFGSTEFERSYVEPPRGPEFRSLHFTVSRVLAPEDLQVPPLPEVDIGGSDDFQVSGFFDKEGGEGLTYRWSGTCGTVYVPGATAGAVVTLRAGIGKRPTPAPLTLSLSGRTLGTASVPAEWTELRFTLPSPLPPGPPLLRLDVPAFRPSNVWKGDPDTRELGVMLDWVRLDPGRR